ncbi:hypothetical protein Cgig2_028760 [Carnegiea gigantea]|uniref:Uncharacterized protein n=1 Tax=Carnegiea gigantea TaxID=171969 RepID=A0A9Q1JQI1_9CARY|nr:hypothetical protein Cgig2_028760 [Carnegiea gigantea]
MTFPLSLSIRDMAEYVAYHFEWDRQGDFQALCPSFELAMAEEAAQRFKLPELSQVIFYAMLLNEAERLGVLYEQMPLVMELALTELRWSTFESCVWLNRDRIFEARFQAKAEQKEESLRAEIGERKEIERAQYSPFVVVFPPLYNTRKMANFRWRRATCPPHPLSDDYQDLCPCFTLPEAERAALDFELPEMVQATFYPMLLNDTVELGIVSGFLVDDLKLTLEGLRWTSFKTSLSHTRDREWEE